MKTNYKVGVKSIVTTQNSGLKSPADKMSDNSSAFVLSPDTKRKSRCRTEVLAAAPKEKVGWYYMWLSSRDIKWFNDLLSGKKSYTVKEDEILKKYLFQFKTFIYTAKEHRKKMEKCFYSEAEYRQHVADSHSMSCFDEDGNFKGQQLSDEEDPGCGYLFVYAPLMKLTRALGIIIPHRYIATDRNTHKEARIPDSQMKDFIQLYESLPWNVSIMKRPISDYVKAHQHVLITGGALKGMKGFIVGMHRDRSFVLSLGSMTLSVCGIHALPFEVIP